MRVSWKERAGEASSKNSSRAPLLLKSMEVSVELDAGADKCLNDGLSTRVGGKEGGRSWRLQSELESSFVAPSNPPRPSLHLQRTTSHLPYTRIDSKSASERLLSLQPLHRSRACVRVPPPSFPRPRNAQRTIQRRESTYLDILRHELCCIWEL